MGQTTLESVDQVALEEHFTEKLNQWVKDPLLEVKNQVEEQREFLEHTNVDQCRLAFSNLDLISLSDTFDFELVQRKLEDLDLSHKCFAKTPKSFKKLKKLAKLNFRHNRLVMKTKPVEKFYLRRNRLVMKTKPVEKLYLRRNRLVMKTKPVEKLYLRRNRLVMKTKPVEKLYLRRNRLVMKTKLVEKLSETDSKLFLAWRVSKKNIDRRLLVKQLSLWVKESSRKKQQHQNKALDQKYLNRRETSDRILAFFESDRRSSCLYLSRLGLASLPNIFHFNPFQHSLKGLDLSHNNLEDLPESLGNLQALTILDLSYNNLRVLPESFTELCALAKLNLSHNNLKYLSEFFGNLQALTILDLSYNNLRFLPESFTELCVLEGLNLSDNYLISLPEPLGDLQALTKLFLRVNRLVDLPESFGKLEALAMLDLGCNRLRRLPKSFANLQALEKLSLSSNQFTHLPESLGNLSALVDLRLRNNQFTELPNSFVNLQALKDLHLGCNRNLSAFPTQLMEQMPHTNVIGFDYGIVSKINLEIDESSFKEIIDQWVKREANLEAGYKLIEFFSTQAPTGEDKLVLSNLNLTSLPDIFHLKPFQSNLRRLVLNANKLTKLPESIGELQNLKKLVLTNNQLDKLLESFKRLQALRRLDLDTNCFTSFPGCLNNLPGLQSLDLSGNNLISLRKINPDNLKALVRLDLSYNFTLFDLPMRILQLSSNCTVDLTGCSLSQRALRRICAQIVEPGYVGPQISFSLNEPSRSQIEEKSVEESLRDLHEKADRSITIFPSNKEGLKLRPWLNRLSSMIDYQREGGIQRTLANKAIEYLELAQVNSVFHDSFYEIIEDASGTCGDRMSLSVLYLGIAYQLTTIDIEDMKTLSNFLLKGPWTLEMLGKIARDKIDSLRFFDEIEVYLGYPIKLKQELEIPIDVEEMLYFGFSTLTDEDLREAKDFVLSQREDEVLCFEFLINHDTWKKALESKYPKEFQLAKVNKNAALEAGDGYDCYEAAKEEFNRILVDLTKMALS
jgi:Leucine-rich repeat (LRR) protein